MKLLLALIFVALLLPTCLHARRVRGGRADPVKDDKVSAAMKMVGAAMASLSKTAEPGPAPPPGLTKVGNHSVLDVGFGAFEAEVAKMAADALGKLNATGNVTEEGRKATANAFKEVFRPVKQEVAKSWMELKPEKRDLFVMKVKSQFVGLFKDGAPAVSRALDLHLKLSAGAPLGPLLGPRRTRIRSRSWVRR